MAIKQNQPTRRVPKTKPVKPTKTVGRTRLVGRNTMLLYRVRARIVGRLVDMGVGRLISVHAVYREQLGNLPTWLASTIALRHSIKLAPVRRESSCRLMPG